MNTINAISYVSAKTLNKLSFKGNEEKKTDTTPCTESDFSLNQDILATLGQADIGIGKKQKNSLFYKNSQGLICSKIDGKPYSGTIVQDGKEYCRKTTFDYNNGKLERMTRFSPDNDMEAEKIYEFSYPDKNNPDIKQVEILQYNDLAGGFTVWDKLTFTPEIYAHHHIGEIELSDTTLVIRDRKTNKKMSETHFLKRGILYPDVYPKEVRDSIGMLTEKHKPKKRTDYYEDGKTVKKITTFDRSSYERSEKTFDKNGNVTSLIFYDMHGRPYEMTYYGITDNPITLREQKPGEKQKMAYEFQVRFLTSRMSDSTENYEGKEPVEIASSGKVESVRLYFRDGNNTTRYEIQNWFLDRESGRTIDIQHPASPGPTPVPPSKTPMKIFNVISSSSLPGDLDLSYFLEEFDKSIDIKHQLLVEDSNGKSGRYYLNGKTHKLSPFPFVDKRINQEKQDKIEELCDKILNFCDKYTLKPEKRPE